MNILIIFLLIAVFIIPLWLLLGNRDREVESQKKDDDSLDSVDSLSFQDEGDLSAPDLPDENLRHSAAKREDLQEGTTHVGDDFHLPNDVGGIIAEDSPFEIYKRTLENAEYYLQNGDFETAQDLYDGLTQRISDEEIRNKINENVDYINNYQQLSATREKEKKIKELDLDEHEIKVSLGGRDFIPENVKIDITPPTIEPKLDIDNIVESITQHISKLNPALSKSSEHIDDILSFQKDLEVLKSELKSLHDLKAEANQLREERLQTDIAELQVLKREIEAENREREKNREIDELRYEIESLRREKDEEKKNEDEIHKLRSTVEELSDKLQEKEQERNQVEKLNETISSLKDELQNREEKNQEVTLLKQQIQNMSNRLLDNESTQADIDGLRDHIESLNKELSESRSKEKELSTLKNQVTSLNIQLSDSSKKEAELDLMRQELGSLNKKLQESESNQHKIDTLNSEISSLKNELHAKEEKSSEINSLKENISQLKEELHESRTKDEDIANLQKKISELEQDQNKRAQELASEENNFLRDQIESLRDQLAQATDESRLNELVRKQAEALAAHTNPEALSSLASELGSLKRELAETREEQKQPRANREPDHTDYHEQKQRSSSQSSQRQDTSDMANTSGQELPAQSNANLNITPNKQKEDPKDDFQTLEEYIHGPKFDEPSEDEILEKILKDTAQSKEKEYEIHGTNNAEDVSDNFDLSKLFAKPTQEDVKDEEFYSQFMERNKPRVKKELPILNVRYRFDKLPEMSSLSKESNVIESTFYKYKGLLEKANEFIKRRRVKDALNYYQVVMDQDIPEEFKKMLQENIDDLNEYLEKYLLNM